MLKFLTTTTEIEDRMVWIFLAIDDDDTLPVKSHHEAIVFTKDGKFTCLIVWLAIDGEVSVFASTIGLSCFNYSPNFTDADVEQNCKKEEKNRYDYHAEDTCWIVFHTAPDLSLNKSNGFY